MATIYDKPVRILLKEMVEDLSIHEDQIITRNTVFEWFQKKYPNIKKSTLAAHLIRMSTNAPSRFHYKANPNGEDDLFFQIDSQHFRLYNPILDPEPIYSRTTSKTPLPGQDSRVTMAIQNPKIRVSLLMREIYRTFLQGIYT